MEKSLKIAALFVASLKAIVLIHQHNHWTSKGDVYYENHLMFERLYNSANEDLDAAAEKFMGLFGEEYLNFELQTKLLGQVLSKYNKLAGQTVAQSLAIEKDFIKFCQDAYDAFEGEGTLSLGLDDMIMNIASNREGAVYHLQQSDFNDQDSK